MKTLFLAGVALIALSTTAHACDLFMQQEGQLLHIIPTGCYLNEGYLQIEAPRGDDRPCAAHLNNLEQVDHVTYLVHFSCGSSLQVQLIGGVTIRITNTENY